jgi:pilus assembly protein CpaB
MTRTNAVVMVTILAVVVAGVAAWSIFSYLQTETKKVKAGQPQNIVVAIVDVPIGAKLADKQVKLAAFPKDSIPQGSISDIKSVQGRVAIRPIAAGDAVTEQKLIPKAGSPGSGVMTYLVPQGHRAITVAVNEVAGVAGFLTPADRVDVVLTTLLPGSTENISKIVLQNVPILAAGQTNEQREGKPVIVQTVTLDLTPEDSEKLVLAASKGQLQLLLRHIADMEQVESKGATIGKVLGGTERPAQRRSAAPVRVRTVVKQVRVPRPAPAPSPVYTVEIIKGKERTTKQFEQ